MDGFSLLPQLLQNSASSELPKLQLFDIVLLKVGGTGALQMKDGAEKKLNSGVSIRSSVGNGLL